MSGCGQPGGMAAAPAAAQRWPIASATRSIASTAGWRRVLGAVDLRRHAGRALRGGRRAACSARPRTWANETTIYLSACAYLLSGGYALAHRRHVRIDLIYDRLSPRTRARLDLFTFLFFLIYVGALIWVGTHDGLELVPEAEGTGTPWNPRIWPVKFAIPLAGLLLLLQGIANLLRDLGGAARTSRAT